MRTSTSIALVLVALAGILGLSVISVWREQDRLIAEFTTETHQQLHESVEVLAARLDSLDQDTRMLTDLVEHARVDKPIDRDTERRVWEGAFRAMAVVVSQYRTIALVDSAGTLEILAVNPTESADTVDALVPLTRRLAGDVVARGNHTLGDTARYGQRSFLLYGKPVSNGRAIVVAIDAALFLGAVAWTPLPGAHLVVTDPAGVVWTGCETAPGCRASAPNAASNPLDLALPGEPHGHVPAVQLSEPVNRSTGRWVVTWLASTQEIKQRQRSMVTRVVLTAMAAAVAVAAAGAMIMRQQRKSVELEERLRYAQALASARETSQAIVENAPLGVLGVSQDGRVVLANGFLTERLGPVQIGAPLAQAFSGPAAAWLRDLEPLLLAGPAAAPASGAGGSEAGGAAPLVIQRDVHAAAPGSPQFQVRIVPVRSHELGVRTFALIEDQSELRNLEHQLVRAEKLITVGVLSAGIAHEIGSPLAVVRGRAEQVLRAVADGPRAEDLRVVIKQIDHISSIIGQVLDFSRRQPIERRAVALETVIDRAHELLAWKVTGKGLRVEQDLEKDLPWLAADPDQLQQVLVNLLLNAADASSGDGRIEIRARRARGGAVEIKVVDGGCGIAPEHMNAVFDPFFTTKKRGEGTGLGLPVAASIVRNHGGEINLHSTVGLGTTVTVTWPAAPRTTAAEAASMEVAHG